MAGKTGRRGHNEGSIYQRADGRWVGAVHLGWESTGRKRKVVYGKTRAEVAQKIAKILNDHQKGLPVQTADTTLAVFLDDWLEDSVKHSVRPRTYDSYKSIANHHLKPALGKVKVAKLTQQHVMEMCAPNALQARQSARSATSGRCFGWRSMRRCGSTWCIATWRRS